MTETHKARHKFLHEAFDELIADFIQHNDGKSPSDTTVMELIMWSHRQTYEPSELPNVPHYGKETK